jgi:hypothetical protein
MAKALYAKFYARFGHWGDLGLILGADPIPADLEDNARRLRRVFLTEQERQEFAEKVREQHSPRKKTTLTWVNEHGETVAIEGYVEEER